MIYLKIVDEKGKEIEFEDLTTTGKEILTNELNRLRDKLIGD